MAIRSLDRSRPGPRFLDSSRARSQCPIHFRLSAGRRSRRAGPIGCRRRSWACSRRCPRLRLPRRSSSRTRGANSAPPNHWNASAFRQRLLHSPPDEAALADEARRVAGLRLGRRERPSVLARSSPPSPETEAAADDPGLRERARLNFLNSYYRGTLFGAGRLAGLAQLAATPDEEGISADLKRVRDDLRQEYRQITADLARYDRMRSFGSAGELGAAALGQLGGAVLSLESWLGLNAKGATWLWRSGKAALQQGAITGTADPIVQALNIRAGVQEQYDPARTGLAVGAGALLGGSLHSAAEALSHIGARPVASSEAGTSAISGPR